MTTAYGLAAVTATLRALLNDGIVEHNLNGILSSLVGVSALPPDRVIPASGLESTQLNLFLGEWLSHCIACGHELTPVL